MRARCGPWAQCGRGTHGPTVGSFKSCFALSVVGTARWCFCGVTQAFGLKRGDATDGAAVEKVWAALFGFSEGLDRAHQQNVSALEEAKKRRQQQAKSRHGVDRRGKAATANERKRPAVNPLSSFENMLTGSAQDLVALSLAERGRRRRSSSVTAENRVQTQRERQRNLAQQAVLMRQRRARRK